MDKTKHSYDALDCYYIPKLAVKEMGRVRHYDFKCYLTYSGSELGFLYSGDLLMAEIFSDDFCKDDRLHAWIGVIVGDDNEPWKRIPITHKQMDYHLFDREQYALWKGVSPDTLPQLLSIRIVKLSEAAFGVVGINCLMFSHDAVCLPLRAKARRIEYIGDSITCGYGVEGVDGIDSFTTTQENPLKSYSLQSAKLLDADYQLVSWSGIGLITDWIPPEVDEPLCETLIPEIYPYTDLRLDNRLNATPQEWDFSLFSPDVVVINIGTNDSSYTREMPEREALFIQAYEKLLAFIRSQYGNVEIMCCYGIMDQTLCGAIETMVAGKQAQGDEHIHYVYFPLQSEADGKGADGHPSLTTHTKAAERLASAVRDVMHWQ